MDNIVDLLIQVELFAQLEMVHLRQLAGLFERTRFDQGDFVTHQGEPGDHFFILESGQAAVWRMDAQGREYLARTLEPGDHFGTTSLLLEDARDATVRAAEKTTFLSLGRSEFNRYLEEHPSIKDTLALPEVVRKQLEAPRFKWMTPGEFTVFYATKTGWVLLMSELLTVVLLLALGAVAIAFHNWLILGLAAALLVLPLALLQWMDWRNDYYVVTNQRVFHHESRLPTLHVSVDQAPLHQIQNVTTLKLNPLSRLLNYGTVEIQTAGTEGSILFRHLDDPLNCQQTIFELVEKSRSMARMSERAAIRQAISLELAGGDEAAVEETAPDEEPEAPVLYTSGEVVWEMGTKAPPPPDKPQRPSGLASLGNRARSLLPSFRQELDGVVTWRKHPFVLMRAISLPALSLAITFLVAYAWLVFTTESPIVVALVMFAIWCPLIAWLLWRYEDWRNDLFQMTASHIIDIDRLPLGFRESRRQASLEQVQNINADIPNLWARLFNFGNVIIETAGTTGDLTFEWVMRPRAVQAEIFTRMEELRTKQRADEAEERRQEMARWFSVYHQMKQEHEE